MQECYYDSVKECGEVNLSLKEAILSVVGTRNIDSYLETDTTEREQEEDTAMSKRRISIECIIGFMSRLRNPNIHNFFIVILSILALGSNVSVEFWSLLTMMGLAFSRSWTINLVREIGDEIAATKPEGSSANVGLAVTDNKAYCENSPCPRRRSGRRCERTSCREWTFSLHRQQYSSAFADTRDRYFTG